MACVYQHIRLDTNEVFYIGIGKSVKRAFSKSSRNTFWRNITKKTEYIVEILFNDVSLKEAFDKEIELIRKHGRRDRGCGTLCNMTNGGDLTYDDLDINLDRRRPKQEVNKKSKAVIQMSYDGEFIKEWKSATQASRELNITCSGISRCCRRIDEARTSGGYIWKYKNFTKDELWNIIRPADLSKKEKMVKILESIVADLSIL